MSNSLAFFEKRLVINLPDRTDRRRDMERELRRANLTAEFFPAIRPESAEPFHMLGVKGCYMSHLTVLKQAIGAASLLIMEDDLNFVHDLDRMSVVHQLPSNWAIFYGSYMDLPHAGGPSTICPMPPKMEVRGSHFYAVAGWAIPKVIEKLEIFMTRERDHPDGGPMPIDGALNIIRQQDTSMVAYVADPGLGYQRISRSDISGKWFDSTFLGPTIERVRRVRNLFVR